MFFKAGFSAGGSCFLFWFLFSWVRASRSSLDFLFFSSLITVQFQLRSLNSFLFLQTFFQGYNRMLQTCMMSLSFKFFCPEKIKISSLCFKGRCAFCKKQKLGFVWCRAAFNMCFFCLFVSDFALKSWKSSFQRKRSSRLQRRSAWLRFW